MELVDMFALVDHSISIVVMVWFIHALLSRFDNILDALLEKQGRSEKEDT